MCDYCINENYALDIQVSHTHRNLVDNHGNSADSHDQIDMRN